MKKKLLSITISLAMMLTIIMAMGSVAYAKTVIKTVTGTSNIQETLVLGEKLVNPSINTVSGYAVYNSGSTINWHRKVGDEWVRCDDTQVVVPGDYCLKGAVFGIYSNSFISYYSNYELSQETKVIIDDKDWGTAISYEDQGNCCFITIDSPVFTIEDDATKRVISSVELEPGTIYCDGEAKTPKLIVKDQAGNDLVEDEDYTVKYSNNVDVTLNGKAEVEVVGIRENGVYGTWHKNFNIEPVPIESVKLSASTYTYNGSVKNPSLIIKDVNGNTLIEDTDYTVTIPSGRKAVGTYTYTVDFQGKYLDSKTVSFKINPAKPAIKSMTPGSKKLTVKLTTKPSSKGAGTYQISYRQKGTSAWKKTTTTSALKTIKSLKKGKQYYVKVRAYKKVGTTTYWGAWTKTKLSKKIK